MCEFCIKHGEGKKWYLQARNYSLDLANDIRRKRLMADFVPKFQRESAAEVEQLERLQRAPGFLRRLVSGWVTWRQKREHFGQVVPIEDVERIVELVGTVVRVPCVCRQVTVGREARLCFGVSISPTPGLSPLDPEGVEVVGKQEAVAMIRDLEQEALLHTVWTFGTPFIGGICNCDRSDCLAMKVSLSLDTKVMFRGEYVAQVDWDLCRGCRRCLSFCQFGAMGFSAARGKAVVDIYHCWGCGLCRAGCQQGALRLLPRETVPQVARIW